MPLSRANYRPITNLNTIGKMLERLAQYQLRQHISTSPNYNTSQSAYRALHSTETAMTKVVNDLLTAVDSGKPTVLLSLDISAAFDMLDHDRLLNRATELFGLSGQVINWLESYLTGRTSYVSIGNRRSSTVNCTTGVPQGSVLGPLLFSIFTSPVSHLISSFNVLCHQYADDTQLYTSIDLSSDHDIINLSDCADAVTRWHLENNLLLNPSKTEVLITGTRQQVTKFESSTPAIQTIRFADTVIPYTKSVRILGVTIDSHLTFDKHAEERQQESGRRQRANTSERRRRRDGRLTRIDESDGKVEESARPTPRSDVSTTCSSDDGSGFW